MGVILKNNAVSTITTAISASDVGLAVTAGTGSLFPALGAGDYFYATLVSSGGTYEVVKVTARVGDTMTIVRAQEGTTAQSFASGSRIEARVTAASITDMVDEHDQASEISFTPTGGISSTNVQNAIAELDSEAAKSIALTASGGSALIGFLQAGTGAQARTAQSKMRDTVSVKDFGAVGDGIADDTAAFQAALDACTDYSQLDLSGGSYLLSSGVSCSNLTRLRVVGNGALIIESSPSIAALMTFDNCDQLRVDDIHFVGSETYAYFQANSPTSRRYFLSVKNSDVVRIKDVTGEKKRGHILLYKCAASIVENSYFKGFFQNISLGVQLNGNECSSVEIQYGSYNKAVHCHAENHGSCVLWGFDSVAPSVINCTGQDLHDNGVYGSSGTRARVFGCDFTALSGSSVKLRGSQNISFGNTSSGNVVGAAFAMSGNGTTLDAYGANGFGNICVANSAANIARDGISVAIQDGYYARDSVFAFNTINNITSTGGYAGIRGTLTQGGVIAGNIMTQLACDYGVLYTGTATITSKANAVCSNIVADLNGTGSQYGIRLGYITESVVNGNVSTDVARLVHTRFATKSTFVGNVNPNGTTVVETISTYSNTDNLVVGNRGANIIDASTHVQSANWPAGNSPATTSTPNSVGQITVTGGQAYIATGTASSADWKQIT